MNSKTAQLTENWTEIVRLFARFALGASFLSAVADRFGLWGPYGAKNVLGRFRSFRGVHGRGDVSLPKFIDSVVCVGSDRRRDTPWDIAHRRLQSANDLRPLRLFFCHLLLEWSQVLASRRHSTIRSSRRPLQHSYWRSGSLTDSRWTSS